jgi:meso-butanediol dehydrogenase / (S,S)-butanediol dehydrogenase / diacetyl reductase
MMFEGRFAGRVALVTAGASGIGNGIVTRLVAEGAQVLVGDVDEAGLERVAKELGVSVWRCDASDEAEVTTLVETAVAQFGRIDCAFNVAGRGLGGGLVDASVEDWDHVVAVSLRSTFLCIKHEARHMIDRGGGGAIVNIASINAIQPAEGSASYNAAKAGVVNLTQSAALELGEHGIRVNAVGPGLVHTPMTHNSLVAFPGIVAAFLDATPLGRYGEPADIAAAATFLASDDATWITGQTLYVDGGQTVTGYPKLLHLRAE